MTKFYKTLAFASIIVSAIINLCAVYIALRQNINLGLHIRKSKERNGKNRRFEIAFRIKKCLPGNAEIIRIPAAQSKN